MNMARTGAMTGVARVDLNDADALRRIDDFVCAHPHGQLFQRPAWLQAVKRGTGQDGFFFVAHRDGTGLAGVLPVVRMRSMLFGRALVSSAFGVGGGVLADEDAAILLGDELARCARAEGFPTAELRGGTSPGAGIVEVVGTGAGGGWNPVEGAHANFSRPLAADDDAELKAIPRKQRAEVRRAIGFELTVAVGRDAAMRAEHHAIYAASVHNLGTPVFPRRLFDAMLDAFGADAEILTVHKDGAALASVLSFRHGDTMMPFWGGGTADARKWRANDLMYWELMRHARAVGCTRFDFGRSKVGSGAFAFKKNWGFDPEPMRYWVHGAPRAVSPNDARYSRKIALWKKLPLPVANLLGPFLSRGLG